MPLCQDARGEFRRARRTMEEHQIRRLPVLEDHRLVGMVSEADLARHLDDGQIAEFVEKVYAR
ncbi:CBS domain-containing protein [Actinosynnema sp. CS-041913]|uniref:CBS domain-containing protein n=1 Tax=Actinosynnema sp. CS-041913 TaxID=3239917 RepID=UPI003D9151B1